MADVRSPVVGTVWKIEAQTGAQVAVGDVIMILESMKMEIPVESEAAGVLTDLLVSEGDHVTEGQSLATLDLT